jgi:hypothetical protein
MARMPGTTWVGEHGSRLMDRYDIVCIHTIVGYAPAHAAHFSVRGDGEILQSRDTRYRSAANLDGNHRVIAIENEDHGKAFNGMKRGPEGLPALTDAQVESNAEILAWVHQTHGTPLVLCPDSRPTSKGLAYHRQGIDGNFGPGTAHPAPGRVSGGEVWTEARGKVCPTDLRINQRPLILERAIQLTIPEDYMATNDARQRLERIEQIAERTETKVDQLAKAEKRRGDNAWRRQAALAAKVKELGGDVDAVLAAVEEEK